jgi:hypothetical protein
LEVAVKLDAEPALGALDIGNDFVMRDATDIGDDNARIRFHVTPEESGLAFLSGEEDEDDDEPDVVITREKDSGGGGGGGTNSEPASIGVSQVNTERTHYENPDVPEVVIVVEPGGGGGGTSTDPYLAVTGGGLLVNNGILQLAMQSGGYAQLQPALDGLSLELIGGDPDGNTGLIGFHVGPVGATSLDTGPVNATSLDTGPVNATSVNTAYLDAASITTGDIHTTDLFAENFDITHLDAASGALDNLTVNNGGGVFLEHGPGLQASMLYGEEFTGDAVLKTPALKLENLYGDQVSMQLINDSFDTSGKSLALSENLQVRGELGISDILTGDQVFFQVMPRFYAMEDEDGDDDDDDDDDDGDVVVKRRTSSGATSTAKVKSSGSVYENPDVPEVVIVVEPGGGGGGTSEDPFLKLSGGDLRLMGESGIQFGSDGRFNLTPNEYNQMVFTGGDLLMNGGNLDVGSGAMVGYHLNAFSAELDSLNVNVLDVAEGGALALSGPSGDAAVGLNPNGYLDMRSPAGVAMTNDGGDSVFMEVITEQGTLSGGTWGSLKVHAPMSSTSLNLGYPGGDQASLHVIDGGLSLDKDLSVDGDVAGSNGSFASDTFGVALVGGPSGVLDAQYTGSAGDRPAVRGVNESAPYWGIGGDFSGGYMGVNARATLPGGGYRYAINAHASGGAANYGLNAIVSDSEASNNYGLKATASDGNNNYGVRAEASGPGYGVYAKGNNGAMAGTFIGNVAVTGSISKGGGSFKIDHPLDPENKYLFHSFVESPDMMNVYNGNAVFDATGEVEVELPDWFEGLNREFRYQLTCVGGFAPVYVSEEIEGNRFTIAGGNEGLKVSWQVTGIRKDPWAEANRIPTEVDKAPADRGSYLHPEAHGLPVERGLYHQRDVRELQASDVAPDGRSDALKRTATIKSSNR